MKKSSLGTNVHKMLTGSGTWMQEADGEVRTFMQEHLESLAIVKAYEVEDMSVSRADVKMCEHRKARIRKNHFSNICNVGFASAMNGAYLLGVIYSAYGIYSGTVSYGTLTALLQLISQIQAPFANITGYMPKYYSMIASAERLMEAEDLTQDLCDATGKTSGDEFEEFGFKDASFSYTGKENKRTDVFKKLDLNIRRGEFVAITGQSGCGKSTMLKLLMSLYPLDGGEKYITLQYKEPAVLDASGRHLFAYVPQGNLLISGSIRDIVTFASEQYDEEAFRRAVKIACADDFINELPEGADTVLKERGGGLSEGQMQRIAIARAIYAGRKILLLDEATSALDAGTEERLLKNLKDMTDRTVIIVTHRRAAIDVCDRQIDLSVKEKA